jgi:tRNA-splicing ligase RtcB
MPLSKTSLKKVSEYIWEIPGSYRSDMRVPGRIFASEKLLEDILKDESLEQVVNVATMPGIEKWSLAMPDIHEGYGFCVGGVAAMNVKSGVISPGGIGFDINCGVRLLASKKSYKEVKNYLADLVRVIYREVPSGVGRGGRLKLNDREFDEVLKKGVLRMKELGYAEDADLRNCESNGGLGESDPGKVSKVARDRGRDQLGTIGAGNHFVEVQRVDEIFDENAAQELGLQKEQVTVMIHCGSRGLGHQVATDYIKEMLRVMPKYGISVPDRQLACAPIDSPEGRNYFAAMSAAANFAWANRELISWEVRQAWQRVLGKDGGGLVLIYDVAHNLAKFEEYFGAKVVVHRKGATRSFPGQPVLIPGSMGTASYVLLGTEQSLEQSFGSTCHGAGRTMSRTRAKRMISGSDLKAKLEQEGIHIAAGSMSGLAEEAPQAYKDVDEVVDVVHKVGIAKKVLRLRPIAVVKG